jgi:hypothetical protein
MPPAVCCPVAWAAFLGGGVGGGGEHVGGRALDDAKQAPTSPHLPQTPHQMPADWDEPALLEEAAQPQVWGGTQQGGEEWSDEGAWQPEAAWQPEEGGEGSWQEAGALQELVPVTREEEEAEPVRHQFHRWDAAAIATAAAACRRRRPPPPPPPVRCRCLLPGCRDMYVAADAGDVEGVSGLMEEMAAQVGWDVNKPHWHPACTGHKAACAHHGRVGCERGGDAGLAGKQGSRRCLCDPTISHHC